MFKCHWDKKDLGLVQMCHLGLQKWSSAAAFKYNEIWFSSMVQASTWCLVQILEKPIPRGEISKMFYPHAVEDRSNPRLCLHQQASFLSSLLKPYPIYLGQIYDFYFSTQPYLKAFHLQLHKRTFLFSLLC